MLSGRAPALLLVTALAVVVAGEATGGGRPLLLVALDALAGTTFLAVGAVSARAGGRRFATLSYGTGVAWFAVNLVPGLAPLHRPLLVHSVLGAPRGRLARRGSVAVVAAAWALALVALPGSVRAAAGVALGLAVVAAAGRAYVTSPLAHRPEAGAVAVASVPLGVALAGPPVLRAVEPVSASADAVAIGYAALVALAGAVLAIDWALRRGRRTDLADAFVELTELGGDDVHAMVESLRRDEARASEPAAAGALAAMAALLDDNRRLHDELAAQVEQVRRSRRRLVDAADVERRRLAGRLASGAGRHLDELDVTWGALAAVPGTSDDLVDHVAGEVAAARDDLDRLGRGLHPRLLVERGLRASLEDLARRAPVPTVARVADGRYSESAETTVWYVCAEATANVAKHARAGHMEIEVTLDGGVLLVTVSDDGVGGARTGTASGLAGLADRLDAIGGRLEVADGAGGGTALRAWVPAA